MSTIDKEMAIMEKQKQKQEQELAELSAKCRQGTKEHKQIYSRLAAMEASEKRIKKRLEVGSVSPIKEEDEDEDEDEDEEEEEVKEAVEESSSSEEEDAADADEDSA